METMIQVNELTKVFKTDEVETWALDKVNIEIGQGEFVAVMGPSGCGKSTLLHILGLLDSPSSGQYLLDGKDVSSCSESKRNELRKGMLGFVFQSFNLIDELTVQENIALPLLYMGVPKQERQRRVEEAMARMDIMHRSRHYPRQISGGQQQRTAIARAIVTEVDFGRRADGKLGFQERQGGDGLAQRTAPRGDDHRHGDPFAARCRICRPHHPSVRRTCAG